MMPVDPVSIGSLGKVAESLTGGGAGPATSGPAQMGGTFFSNGGINVNKPNYVMWGVIVLGLVFGFLLLKKK